MTTKSITRLLAVGAALAAAAGLLAGCNDEERPLHFAKGKYAGPQDAPLSAEQLDSLKQRVNNGRF